MAALEGSRVDPRDYWVIRPPCDCQLSKSGQTPPGLALELHVYLRREGTLAVWILESGRVLGEAVVGQA